MSEYTVQHSYSGTNTLSGIFMQFLKQDLKDFFIIGLGDETGTPTENPCRHMVFADTVES